MVGGRRPFALKEPLVPDLGLVVPLHRGIHRYRLFTGVLHVDFEMILHVFPHAGKVLDDIDAQPRQVRGIAHAGKLQQLGGIDGTTAADDFAAIDLAGAPCP